MNDPETTAAIARSLAEIETAHPELHALLSRLAEVLSVAEIDPESDLASPATALVAAFGA